LGASCRPPSPPVPRPANVEIVLGPKPATGPVATPFKETLKESPAASVTNTAPCRLPDFVGWNFTATVQDPAVRVGQVVPAATAV